MLSAFDIPFWPQLPRLSFREQMIPQFSEGLPFIRVDDEKGSVWVERSKSDELERYYETVTDEMRLAISESYAEGLHAFLRKTRGKAFPYLKGQITGPLTFTLGLNDSTGKPVFYDEELREVYLMGLKAKARWQADILKSRADDALIFVDEPIASSLGSSSYISVSRTESVRLLKEIVNSVKDAGAISAIHCCGRAEWPLFIESGMDILSFDAFDFGETLALYPAEFRNFLEEGGTLAWGIVPTTETVNQETDESLFKVYLDRLNYLEKYLPGDLLRERVILTPACGTASRSVEETLKVFQLLLKLKEALV